MFFFDTTKEIYLVLNAQEGSNIMSGQQLLKSLVYFLRFNNSQNFPAGNSCAFLWLYF